jgi:SMC interacting uncharacterized protein involved in chromosome segregation
MKDMETPLRAYRCLYWANQGLLQALRALKELDEERAASEKKKALRRTQAMIEKTRTLMNCRMSGWVGDLEIICVEISEKNTGRF